MANKHYRNWLFQLPLGFIFIIASVFILMYTIKKAPEVQWVNLTILASASLVIGLIFFASAVIHKVKSDFIRKSKKRHSSSTVTMEEGNS